MPINVNLTYRANLANPLTWAQGDANFKMLADNDQFLNSAVEAAALAASQANTNANGRQPSNAKLTAIAASVWAANQMILTTGANTLSMIPVNSYGLNYLNYANKNEVRNELSINNVDNTPDLDKPISTAAQTALNAKISNSQKGVANGVAVLGADGKLPVSQLPPLAVNDTFIVNSQAEQLALVAERGDMAFRTDQANTPYVLTTDNPAVFSNWKSLDKTLSDSLAALNVLTPAADRIPFFTGALTAGLQVLTTVGKALLSAVDKAAGRTAIDAAKIGQNSDITEITGLTIPLSRQQGGIGGFSGFIEGLTMSWLSSTSVSVDAGSAYIPSLGKVVTFAGQTFTPMGVIDVNSFIYLYLTDSGTIQQSLTVPVKYANQAWQMTGNNARRCIGALHVTTNANGVTKFVHRPQLGLILYTLGNPQASPFRLLAGITGIGSITTRTVTPVTAHTMEGTFQNTGTLAARVTPSDAGTNVATGWMAFINPGQIWNAKMAIAPDGGITYDATSPAALSVYCQGYYFDR